MHDEPSWHILGLEPLPASVDFEERFVSMFRSTQALRRFVPRIAAVLALAIPLWPSPVLAHPHIWIDVVGTFLFDDRQLAGIRFEWTMDNFFSAGIIGTFDEDRNREFSEAEQTKIKAEAFDGVREGNYFTDVRIGGEMLKIEEIEDFQAELKKGQVVYRFTVALPQMVDPADTSVSFSIYDKSFFVDIGLVKDDPVRFRDLGNGSCHFRIDEDRTNPIYFGVIFPDIVHLLCGK